ncbi:hypothetical protein NMY22_g8461 [Coprinellus aureogranulatus]|nr:hypothetical protein NMY22_g8461 [Coprinellus aureogranulatus]
MPPRLSSREKRAQGAVRKQQEAEAEARHMADETRVRRSARNKENEARARIVSLQRSSNSKSQNSQAAVEPSKRKRTESMQQPTQPKKRSKSTPGTTRDTESNRRSATAQSRRSAVIPEDIDVDSWRNSARNSSANSTGPNMRTDEAMPTRSKSGKGKQVPSPNEGDDEIFAQEEDAAQASDDDFGPRGDDEDGDGDVSAEEEDEGVQDEIDTMEIPRWKDARGNDQRESSKEPRPNIDLFDNDDDVEYARPQEDDRRSGSPEIEITSDKGAHPKPARPQVGKRELARRAEEPHWSSDETLAPRGAKAQTPTSEELTDGLGCPPRQMRHSQPGRWHWSTALYFEKGRINLLKQNPVVRGVLDQAIEDAVVYALTKTFYPPPEQVDAIMKKIICDAARNSELEHASHIAVRMKEDIAYGDVMVPLVRARFNGLRAAIYHQCVNVVPGHYRLQAGCKELVSELKKDDSFIFPRSTSNVVDTKRPYQHEGIIAALRQSFRKKAVGQKHITVFKSSMPENSRHQEPELSIPLLALTAALVYAEINNWSTGVKEDPDSSFNADTHASAYRHHAQRLQDLKTHSLSKFHVLMKTLLSLARANSRGDDSLQMQQSDKLQILNIDGMEDVSDE